MHLVPLNGSNNHTLTKTEKSILLDVFLHTSYSFNPIYTNTLMKAFVSLLLLWQRQLATKIHLQTGNEFYFHVLSTPIAQFVIHLTQRKITGEEKWRLILNTRYILTDLVLLGTKVHKASARDLHHCLSAANLDVLFHISFCSLVLSCHVSFGQPHVSLPSSC